MTALNDMDATQDLEPSSINVAGIADPATLGNDMRPKDTKRGLRPGALLAGSLLSLAALFWLINTPLPPAVTTISNNHDELAAAMPEKDAPASPVSLKKVSSAWHLIDELKKHNLWEIQTGKAISPFLLSAYPSDLEKLSVYEKKKAFLNALLPAALMANQEVLQERELLLAVLDKIPTQIEHLKFGLKNKSTWQFGLDGEEISFIKSLTKKYRTKQATELLERVNVIPVSLILAQGALESSWGTSRFTKEGNSLFGMWTWEKNGIVPLSREEGKTHRVEAYDSILASLKKYMLTLNRLDAYAEFRAKRTASFDPYELAEGLQLYSERGEDYVDDIKRVISSNSLTVYDTVLFPRVLVSLSNQGPLDDVAVTYARL